MHRVSWEQRRETSNPDLTAKNEAAQARFPVRVESLEQDLIALVHTDIPRTQHNAQYARETQ